jgi:hypothetical protein
MKARTKLSPKKQQALDALLVHPSVAKAASAAGVPTHVLQRWIDKDPEFGAAYRAAKRAGHRQNRRRLAQRFAGAVGTTVWLMYSGKKAPTRLRAARDIITLAKEAYEFEADAAAIAEAERLIEACRPGSLPASMRGKRGIKGHGARFPRDEEKAATALLTERTVAAAADVVGITRQTLTRWMEVPAFLARLAAAADAVFGEGMRLAQQREGDAFAVIWNLSADPLIPEETRRQASRYLTREGIAQAKEDQDTRAAEAEAAAGSTGNSETEEKREASGRNLRQRLNRIKGALSPARWADEEFEFVYAEDGRPTGLTSVRGPDGRQRWRVPPPGSRAGDVVPDQEAA